jgi:hypothetical protein
MMKRVHTAVLLLLTGLAGCVPPPPPAYAPVAAQLNPYPAVPPPRAEPVPPPPRERLVWQPGHWHWNGASYQWIPGRYVDQVAGARWVPGHWEQRGGAWGWAPGHWG